MPDITFTKIDEPPASPASPAQSSPGAGVTFEPLDKPPTAAPTSSTTIPGLAAAAGRGAAPYAAGAGIGAALGAPLAGVGAIPGALAGMGAVGATQLGGDVWNFISRKLGGPQMTTPQEAMDRVLDKLGIKRPGTPAEQLTETAASMAPFGASAAQELGDAVAHNSDAAVDRFIQSHYARAIKPSVATAKTASQLGAYNQQVRAAIDSIVDNKGALNFTDAEGQTAGELPKSIQQFSDAIEQTKQAVFEKYDALARQAGQAGARVNLEPTVRELQKIAADPVVRDLHPDLASYAESSAQRLADRGSYSTVDAQRAVQNLNQSLKAFYSNPTYETASRAGVDAMVANQLRAGLDKAIESAASPGYQELKNQYGALKTIEKDVVHRAIVEGRKNLGGGLMGNIGDIVSADELIRGLVTLSPASLARGVALKGFTQFVRHLRDPNRAIEKLFGAAEKQKNVRDLARQMLPTYSADPLLALPAPEVAGPGAPWARAGESIMPSGPSFKMSHPAPSALRDHSQAEQIKKDIEIVARHLARIRQQALPAPPTRPLLPPPATIYGPQQPWISTGEGLLPGNGPAFTMTAQ
jgi:hypothetical protein